MQQATINRLESQVRSLESTLAAMARHIANTPSANETLPMELRRYVARFTVPVRANSDARPSSPVLKVTPINELSLDDNNECHKEHPLDMICTDVNFKVGSLPRGGTRRSPQPPSRILESNKSAMSRGGS
ncbi:hypothetical protein B566_EDAN010246 [Ephemera danica]|nr:hypothetical protein B566_EDAN010246 [Ephemera danica]